MRGHQHVHARASVSGACVFVFGDRLLFSAPCPRVSVSVSARAAGHPAACPPQHLKHVNSEGSARLEFDAQCQPLHPSVEPSLKCSADA